MAINFDDFPGWIFEIEEVSANVYEVVGRNGSGEFVFSKGADPDVLIEECKMEVRRLFFLPPVGWRLDK